MFNKDQEVYTAANLTELITCLDSLGFDSAKLDLILSNPQELNALRRLLSEVPEAINPEHSHELFRALIITLGRNFELFELMREKQSCSAKK